MHNYSIESPERKTVPFFLALLAIVVTLLAQEVSSSFAWQIPSWIAHPSAFALYGLLYTGFDRYFWKCRLLRTIGLVQVPIFQEAWKVTMSSSLDSFKEEFVGRVSISQTWSRIHVFFNGNDAFSHSQTAALTFMGPSRCTFIYVYQSEKRPQFADNEYLHFGTSRVIGDLSNDGIVNQLEGSYFTDKSRHSYGKIRLSEQS